MSSHVDILIPKRSKSGTKYYDARGNCINDLPHEGAGYIIDGRGTFQRGVYRKGGVTALIDSDFNLLTEYLYSDIYVKPRSQTPLFLCSIGEGRETRFGYISRDGAQVIPCKYLKAGHFWEGRAMVAETDRCSFHYIDTAGELLFSEPYIGGADKDFGGGRFPLTGPNYHLGYKGLDGEWAIPPRDMSAGHFREGFTYVQFDVRKKASCPIEMFVDRDFNVLHRKKYDSCFAEISCGRIVLTQKVKKKWLFGMLDYNFETILPFTVPHMGRFSCGLARYVVESNREGFIDVDGVVRVPPIYKLVYPYEYGVAMALKDNTVYFLNTDGEVILTNP